MLKKLDWDSITFGYPVYFLKCNGYLTEASELVESLKNLSFKLCYIETIYYDHLFLSNLLKTFKNSLFVSEKVSFKITPKNSKTKCSVLNFDQKQQYKKEIIDLCVSSGHYSRFCKDPNFVLDEFLTLYKSWALSAIDFENKSIVAVFNSHGEIVGMTIVSIEGLDLFIEIIAVNQEYRQKGYGELLLDTVHSFAFSKGISSIKVVTQHENKGAVSFYLKNGFEIAASSFQYHVWNS